MTFSALGFFDVDAQYGACGARLGSVVGVDLGRDSAKVKSPRGEASVGPRSVGDESAALGGGNGFGSEADFALELKRFRVREQCSRNERNHFCDVQVVCREVPLALAVAQFAVEVEGPTGDVEGSARNRKHAIASVHFGFAFDTDRAGREVRHPKFPVQFGREGVCVELAPCPDAFCDQRLRPRRVSMAAQRDFCVEYRDAVELDRSLSSFA